jgi:Carboxypeptidase regulatory-like domain/TonB dependent receptor/TonB-dependent Receptor Plug Domain
MMRDTLLSKLRKAAAVGGAMALALAGAPGAGAQTTTARITGTVRGEGGAPVPEATVTARSVTTNTSRSARTGENGFYSIAGLVPDAYTLTVQRIGQEPQTRQVRPQVGQVLTENFDLSSAAVQLTTVQVVATAPATETRTSEVATNVTQAQIENLPTPSRNFLDLAQLAPGTRVSPDRVNGTSKTFAAGAQPAQNINVFVDGATYKNDVIPGGVAGQQDSRGNPFPRNAVQEFRITTSNFKAEYQKSSSAIISAVTRSGGNSWEGSSFVELQNQEFVALDTFARKDKQIADSIAGATSQPSTFIDPDYRRYLVGLSLGGPIVRDKLFFFGSYEGNYQNREGVTRFTGDPTIWPAEIQALQGESHTSPFRSNLFFGKLTYNRSERQRVELTGDVRHETDQRAFGGQFGDRQRSFEAAEDYKNTVYSGRVKHSFFGDEKVNEAQIGYQMYSYNPSAVNANLIGRDYQGIGRIGGSDNGQDLKQGRLSLRNDFTYTGFRAGGQHEIKLGGNFDFVTYDMTKTINENPTFVFNEVNDFAFPIEARIAQGDPNLKTDNTQVGVYVQDDWSPTNRLTINLGVRWDYESGMYNPDFVTPQNVRDSLTALRDQLFIDIDPERYFTDGDDREAFFGAFQPRVGLSYALDREARTTLFGGFGLFYDRHPFNAFIDETFRAQHPLYIVRFQPPGGTDPNRIDWNDQYLSREGLLNAINTGVAPERQEIFLLPNDLKPPRAHQWSAGLRHNFGSWNASATYNGSKSFNGFSFEWANFGPNENGGCCASVDIPAYTNVLVGNNNVKTWYNALLMQIDRPYRPVENGWGWGAGINYTLAKAEQQGRGDFFNFYNIYAFEGGRFEINNSERHRVVMNGILDIPYLWGIQGSTLITLGSGYRFGRTVENPPPIPNTESPNTSEPEKYSFILPNAWGYRNVDLRLRKDFPNFAGNRLAITADLFNAFNFDNFGDFDASYITIQDGQQVVNPNYGTPRAVISDARRFQLGLQLDY